MASLFELEAQKALLVLKEFVLDEPSLDFFIGQPPKGQRALVESWLTMKPGTASLEKMRAFDGVARLLKAHGR